MAHQSHALLTGTYRPDQSNLVSAGHALSGATVEQQHTIARLGGVSVGGPHLENIREVNRNNRRSISNPKQSSKTKRYASANPSKKVPPQSDYKDPTRQLNEASSKNFQNVNPGKKGRRQNSQLSQNEKLS